MSREPKPITVWTRSSTRYGRYIFNHISDGWSMNDYPSSSFESQRKEWANSYWERTFAVLVDGHVDINAGQNAIVHNLLKASNENSRLKSILRKAAKALNEA